MRKNTRTSNRGRWLLAVVLLLGPSLVLGGADAPAGPARLVQDINRLPDPDMGSFARKLHRLGDIAIFLATTRDTGYELWRTDGTEAGTRLVRDIYPGPTSSFGSRYAPHPQALELVELAGRLFFIADDGVHGFELWKTDGTEQGTTLVKDINPGSADSLLRLDEDYHPLLALVQAEAGDLMFFVANDGVHGIELWRTDGTAAGTLLLKDFIPGSQGAFGSFSVFTLAATELDGLLLFSASDPTYGRELWRSDGTEAGTVLVRDFHAGALDSNAANFVALNGSVLFTAYDGEAGGLWTTDGTAAGTLLLMRLWFFSSSFAATPFFRVGDNVFFTMNSVGTNDELWKSDGTAEGTIIVKDINPTGHSSPRFVDEVDGTIFFSADDGVHGRELWKTDGTETGTVLVRDIVPGNASPSISRQMGRLGEVLFLVIDDGVHGYELWQSDGTETGTRLVADAAPGADSSFPQPLAELNDAILFEAQGRIWKSDGTPAGTVAVRELAILWDGYGSSRSAVLRGVALFGADDGIHGFELWQSDGTERGTVLVKDVNPLIHTQDSLWGASFLPLPGVAPRTLVLGAEDGVHGRELWIADGRAGGAKLLKDIRPGPEGSFPEFPIELDGVWYFAADDGVHGRDLWRSDGTEEGTFLVTDLYPGPGSRAWPVGVLGDSLFFTAVGDSQWGLWKTDGTEQGTVFVAAVWAEPSSTAVLGGALYFMGEDDLTGLELWKTDGTEAGTVVVADIYPGYEGSYPQELTVFRDTLVFTAFDAERGYSLWRSDGTPEGTRLVRDINPDNSALGFHSGFHEVGGNLFFIARDTVHGAELWKTDGTEEGTVMVKDIRPGSNHSAPASLTAVGGSVFFTAFVEAAGYALWKSDGTEEGTVIVKPGLKVGSLTDVDGLLLFTGYSTAHGAELWRSDGTKEGTFEVQDLAPGPTSSRPTQFTVAGKHVFFAADDGTSGHEPWVAHAASLLGEPLHDQSARILP